MNYIKRLHSDYDTYLSTEKDRIRIELRSTEWKYKNATDESTNLSKDINHEIIEFAHEYDQEVNRLTQYEDNHKAHARWWDSLKTMLLTELSESKRINTWLSNSRE